MYIHLQTMPLQGRPVTAWNNPGWNQIFALYLYEPNDQRVLILYRHPRLPGEQEGANLTPLLAGSQPMGSEAELLRRFWDEVHQRLQNNRLTQPYFYDGWGYVLPTLWSRTQAHEIRLPFTTPCFDLHPVVRSVSLAEVYTLCGPLEPVPMERLWELLGYPPPPVPEGEAMQILLKSQHPEALRLVLQTGLHYVQGLAALNEAFTRNRGHFLDTTEYLL